MTDKTALAAEEPDPNEAFQSLIEQHQQAYHHILPPAPHGCGGCHCCHHCHCWHTHWYPTTPVWTSTPMPLTPGVTYTATNINTAANPGFGNVYYS